MRYITDAEVEELVTTDDAIAYIEDGFRAFAAGEAAVQPRMRIESAGVKLSTLGAVIPRLGYAGSKVYTTIAGRFSFVLVMFRTGDGAPVAMMDGNALTRIRTGAVTALAARCLSAPDSRVLTVFGTGVQARAHALAIPKVRPIEEIRVVARKSSPEFVAEIRERTGIATSQAAAGDALADADIVVTATRSTTPLFDGNALKPGSFVAAIGSSLPTTRELDDAAFRRSGRIVVEWLEQTKAEAGDLILADRNGAIDWSRMCELGSVIDGTPHAGAADGITIYKSVGFGLEDIALAALACERAMARA